MDNFQEQLASPRIEDKNSTINWFGCQVSLERFMDSHSIDVSVINKPNDLVSEEVSVILRI
jgi:hypothetical protein